jgi:hypothetical protein
MIVNSLRCYLPRTVHDHETVTPVREVVRVFPRGRFGPASWLQAIAASRLLPGMQM